MEEDYLPVLRLCAVLDCTQQVGALANAFRIRELNIDLAEPESDIVGHFEAHRPDILMLNPDVLPEKYIAELAGGLREKDVLPRMFITVGSSSERAKAAAGHFGAHLHVSAPIYPPRDSEYLEKLFLTRVISRDYYIEKLRQMTQITLAAMHCKRDSVGFDYLTYAVVTVLSNPYLYFGSAQAINRRIAEKFGVTPANVTSVLSNTISKALHKMTKAELGAAFDGYDIDGEPTSVEFIYAAARLTSRPAKRVLANLLDEPFEYPQRKMKMI